MPEAIVKAGANSAVIWTFGGKVLALFLVVWVVFMGYGFLRNLLS